MKCQYTVSGKLWKERQKGIHIWIILCLYMLALLKKKRLTMKTTCDIQFVQD
ncbi:unnamed protein product [Brassica oleracea]